MQHGEADGLELAADGGIETRASGDEVAHARAEHVVHASEEDFAEIDAELASEGGDGQHGAEDGADDRAFLLHLFLNAVEDEVEELRHAGEDGDAALLQGAQAVRWCSSIRDRRHACRRTRGNMMLAIWASE